MEPISFTASAPFAICRKICCLWLAILLILCIITYTSIRVFIFTRISFSTTSSKVDLGQLCFSTSELLSSCIVYGNKIIVIVIVVIVIVIVIVIPNIKNYGAVLLRSHSHHARSMRESVGALWYFVVVRCRSILDKTAQYTWCDNQVQRWCIW